MEHKARSKCRHKKGRKILWYKCKISWARLKNKEGLRHGKEVSEERKRSMEGQTQGRKETT